MTDNQFNQIFGLVTKTVEATQRLEKVVTVIQQDVSELKQDVSELKPGQANIEKEMKIMSRSMADLARDAMTTRARVGVLEDQIELSN